MTTTLDDATLSTTVEAIDAAGRSGRLTTDSMNNIKRWLTQPPFRKYAPRIVELVREEQFDTLDSLFWEVIPFGTGGRRGTMAELGSATINERTIAESAHGLAVYLKQARGSAGGRVVIARDTRNRSDEFARLTATTLAAHGLKVFCFESPRATPELSFAVRHLGCDAGVMISASHNPPSDNGFKAYWATGGQVLPPHDVGIIQCVNEAGDIPTADFNAAVEAGQIELLGEEIDGAYISQVTALSLSEARDVRAVFTPLHGVGETSTFRILQEAGFDGVTMFEPHRAPDGNFPNVPDHLPNPERPEVFQPAFEEARRQDADVILATDPDADRIGAMVRTDTGEYEYLSGNRIGALLTDYVVRKRKQAGTLSPAHYVVETLVTTPLIADIARSHNVRAIDDLLVGFKYIAETMDREGPERFVFGAEESLGYLAGQYARDKDAAVGALYLLEAAAELRAEGKTLWHRLDELFLQHGYYLEGQQSKVCTGPQGKQQIDSIMQAFRQTPPQAFCGIPLVEVRDYREQEVRTLPDNVKTDDLSEPSGNLLFFASQPGEREYRIAVRPSGTEPKIKFYFFVKQTCDAAARLPEVKRDSSEFLRTLQNELLEWSGRAVV